MSKEQEIKDPEDLLHSILNSTYEFLRLRGGDTWVVRFLASTLNNLYIFLDSLGGEDLLRDWCEYIAEYGVWSGVVEATAKGGTQGLSLIHI